MNHLEEELGSDAHEKIHLEVVVVGDERTRSSTAGDHVHHRRLDLEEAEVVKETAQVVDNLCAMRVCMLDLIDESALSRKPGDEFLTHVVVHEQIKVALAVARLLVLEALVQVWQHTEAR